MNFIKPKLFLMLIFCCPLVLSAQLTLNNIFADHMVLQQNANIKVWGTASSNESVEVKMSFLNKTVKINADDKGNWVAQIKTPAHGGPYQMFIKGKQNQINIKDIYLGEVWLASGQSNMQFPLDSSSKGYNGPVNFKEEIKNANYPLIRQYLVRGTIARTEKNSLVGEWVIVKPENARKLSALAYFYARNLHKDLNVPIGIINSSWGGTSIGSWMSAKDLQTFKADVKKLEKITNDSIKVNENYPSVLYNGMINPIKNYTIKGVIWCQGENSINNPIDYSERMKCLINGWRSSFDQKKLPFLFVQMAPFNYLGRPKQWFSGTANSLGYLVEQQVKALALDDVFMARTGDIGDVKNIHYRNKQDVGHRLSLIALKEIYHKDKGIVNGPDVSKIEYLGNKAMVTYTNTGTNLQVKGNVLNGFELSEDGINFVSAIAVLEGNKVIVKSDDLTKATAIRYCFKNVQEVNLFNAAGLPALPFRTDNVIYVQPAN